MTTITSLCCLGDIVQLSALLRPGQTIALPEKLKTDLLAFVRAVQLLNRPQHTEAIRRIVDAYGLG